MAKRAALLPLSRCGVHTMERRRSHTWKVGAGLWRANIRIDNHGENLGNFAAEEDAARAFDRRARQVGRASNFPTDHQVDEAEVSATLMLSFHRICCGTIPKRVHSICCYTIHNV